MTCIQRRERENRCFPSCVGFLPGDDNLSFLPWHDGQVIVALYIQDDFGGIDDPLGKRTHEDEVAVPVQTQDGAVRDESRLRVQTNPTIFAGVGVQGKESVVGREEIEVARDPADIRHMIRILRVRVDPEGLGAAIRGNSQ